MSEDIIPTRSELQKLKKQIKLAKFGHGLLEKKRDGLILEFFKILKEAKSLRQEMTEAYKKAFGELNKARVVVGDVYLESLSLAVKNDPKVKLEQKNIMGVVVQNITSDKLVKKFNERGYGILGVDSSVDNAAFEYEKVVEYVIKAAEVETAMKKLLDEIEKTKRRVNALEFEVIPKLNSQKSFIQMRLDEMERENIFRMKRIKKK